MHRAQISHLVSHPRQPSPYSRTGAAGALAAKSCPTRRFRYLTATGTGAALFTCHHPSRCVPVWLRSHHAPDSERSDRVTDASAACWSPSLESVWTCQLSSPFNRPPIYWPFLDPPSIDSLMMVTLKPCTSGPKNVSVPKPLIVTSTYNNVVDVNGRCDSNDEASQQSHE